MTNSLEQNDGWVAVCAADEIDDEDVYGFEFEGRHYAVYRLSATEFYASDGLCTHENVILAEGFIFDGCIECPLHASCFDVKTGKVQTNPASEDLVMYTAERRGDTVYIQLNSG